MTKPRGWVEGAFEARGERRRTMATYALAALLYGALLVPSLAQARWLPAPPELARLRTPAGAADVVARHIALEGKRRFVERLKAEVASGDLTHGAAIVRLNHLDAVEADPESRFDLDKAEATYASMLDDARRLVRAGTKAVKAIAEVTYANGYTTFKRIHSRLGDALLHGGGSCEAQTHLAVSLAKDLGLAERTSIRVFSNHLAPVVVEDGVERSFGMVANCRGRGVSIDADLLDRYALDDADARAGFVYPASSVPCDDPETDFAERPLAERDPPATARSYEYWQSAFDQRRWCGEPLRPWDWYVNDVSIDFGDGEPSLRVTPVRPTLANLRHQSERVRCQQRRVARLRAARATAPQLLPEIGNLIGMYEEAALTFAAAGHLDFVRSFQERRTKAWREGQRLIESVDWTSPAGREHAARLRSFSHWTLVFFGPKGKEVIFHAAERDPSSLGALIAEPDTRARALAKLADFQPMQRLWVLRSLPLDDPAFTKELKNEEASAALLEVSDAIDAVPRGWTSCKSEDFLDRVEREIESRAIDDVWLPGVAMEAANSAKVLQPKQPCFDERMTVFEDIAAWIRKLPPHVLEANGARNVDLEEAEP